MSQINDMLLELRDKFKLSHKQALFVYHYAGNATDAGKLAGYKNPGECSRLLQKDTIRRALLHVNTRENTPAVCTRAEILELYTSIARDTCNNTGERLRALDSLARTNGMFIDRQQLQGMFSVEHLDKYSDQELKNKVTELLSFLSDQKVLSPGCLLLSSTPDTSDGD